MKSTIELDGKKYAISPLNLKLFRRLSKEFGLLAAKGWPNDPAALFGPMLRILKKACPTVPRKAWKAAPAAEIAAAFSAVLERWGLGKKK